MNNQNKLKYSDIATNAGRQLIDGLGDLAEAGLDSASFNLFLDEIPVIKTITGFYKAGIVIREGLYAKKLEEFFRAASKSSGPSRKEREQAMKNFGGEENRQRLGETLMLLLDRADDMRKPQLHGYIIGYLIDGYLQYSEAMTLCAIVDRIILEDIKFLVRADPSIIVSDTGFDFSAIHRLQSNGLIYQSAIDGGDFDTDISTHQFSLTSVGSQLSNIYISLHNNFI